VEPPAAHITAWDLADRLAGGKTPVIVREHEIEHGFFDLDPCNLHPGQAAVVAQRLAEELDRAQGSNTVLASSLVERRARRHQERRSWPD
jgi:D-glucosaminate-6-phosphate ammonia-lyase